MIVGFFLKIILVTLQFIVGLLPAATGNYAFPAGITTAIQTIWYYMNAWNFLFPVSTLLSVLAFAFLFHAVMLAWNFGNWFMRYIRGR